MLGQFSYNEVNDLNSTPAFVFFTTFIMIVYLILLNMFLAIINNAYARVMVDAMKDKVMEHQLQDKGALGRPKSASLPYLPI